MFTVKNNINQPLAVGGRSLAVDGTIRIRSVDDEARRLEKRGYVSIIEDEKPKPSTDNKPKEEKK